MGRDRRVSGVARAARALAPQPLRPERPRRQDRATAACPGSVRSGVGPVLPDAGLHGYDIARHIEDRSSGTLRFTLASLYATLYRLEERGLIRGRWVERAGQRRRRYYRITDTGKAMLATQREEWGRFIAALTHVAGLKPA